MRLVQGANPKVQEFYCGGCGLKLSKAKGASPESDVKRDYFIPVDGDQTVLGDKESPSSSEKKERTSRSKSKKKQKQTQRASELRRISTELKARVRDLEIQTERRIEELQALVVQIDQLIDSYED